jgi:hypothetical protein
MMHVSEFTPDSSKISMICDDNEKTALQFYALYRNIKKEWPEARRKLGGIAFVDDRYQFGVQASDIVGSLMRLEAGKRIHGTPYDYEPLYEALIAKPEPHERWLFNISVAIADHSKMQQTADDMREHFEQAARENAEEQRRIREIRQNYAEANQRSPQRDKSQAGRGKTRKSKAEG